MTKEEPVILSERERAIVESAAELLGLSFDEAVSKLFSQGLARRTQKRVGKKPSSVRRLRS